jgi:hypothetical protein
MADNQCRLTSSPEDVRSDELRATTLFSRIRRTSLLTALAASLFVACGTLPPVSTSVDYCCKTTVVGATSFRVEFDNVAEFLKPMLRDEVAFVLHGKGLEYTEVAAESILKMTYVHNVLPEVTTVKPVDSFGETTTPGGATRFIAEMRIELRDADSGELMMSGTMVRAHFVQMGAYMHDAPARAAIREAFTALFAAFPVEK